MWIMNAVIRGREHGPVRSDTGSQKLVTVSQAVAAPVFPLCSPFDKKKKKKEEGKKRHTERKVTLCPCETLSLWDGDSLLWDAPAVWVSLSSGGAQWVRASLVRTVQPTWACGSGDNGASVGSVLHASFPDVPSSTDNTQNSGDGEGGGQVWGRLFGFLGVTVFPLIPHCRRFISNAAAVHKQARLPIGQWLS